MEGSREQVKALSTAAATHQAQRCKGQEHAAPMCWMLDAGSAATAHLRHCGAATSGCALSRLLCRTSCLVSPTKSGQFQGAELCWYSCCSLLLPALSFAARICCSRFT